jgi:hypothetical protein
LSDADAAVAMRRSKREWARYTDDLTDAQRRRAIDDMPCGPDAWPPSPVEFRHLALGTGGARGWALAHRPFEPTEAVSDEQQAARRQAGDAAIAEMRAALKVRQQAEGCEALPGLSDGDRAVMADLERRA